MTVPAWFPIEWVATVVVGIVLLWWPTLLDHWRARRRRAAAARIVRRWERERWPHV